MEPTNIKQAFAWALLAVAVGLALLAVVVIGSALLVAALLPRGHPWADRLRALAGEVPGWMVRGVAAVDKLMLLAFLLGVAGAVALAIVYA